MPFLSYYRLFKYYLEVLYGMRNTVNLFHSKKINFFINIFMMTSSPDTFIYIYKKINKNVYDFQHWNSRLRLFIVMWFTQRGNDCSARQEELFCFKTVINIAYLKANRFHRQGSVYRLNFLNIICLDFIVSPRVPRHSFI